MKYTYAVDGRAAGDQTWSTRGEIDVRPGDFALAPSKALAASFDQLTKGKAVYGQLGVGCHGPYRITRLLIEESKP